MDPAALAVAGAESLATSALNIWQADVNRDFQRDMAGTAVQRQVKDMQKAGINPVMAARFGGAGVPGGSSAQASPTRIASTAIEAQSAKANIQNQLAQAELVRKQTERANLENLEFMDMSEERLESRRAQLRELITKGDLNKVQAAQVYQALQETVERIKLLRSQTAHSALDMARARAESEFFSGVGGKVAPWMRELNPAVKTGLDALRLIPGTGSTIRHKYQFEGSSARSNSGVDWNAINRERRR